MGTEQMGFPVTGLLHLGFMHFPSGVFSVTLCTAPLPFLAFTSHGPLKPLQGGGRTHPRVVLVQSPMAIGDWCVPVLEAVAHLGRCSSSLAVCACVRINTHVLLSSACLGWAWGFAFLTSPQGLSSEPGCEASHGAGWWDPELSEQGWRQ